jgi:poly(A) polymerase
MAADTAFRDDPLRILRAWRIAGELGFRIEARTAAAAGRSAALLRRTAGERVRDELFRILALADAHRYIAALERAGILAIVLPEIAVMKRSARRFYYHPAGLWQHSLETLSSLEEILRRPGRYLPGFGERMSSYCREEMTPGITRGALIKAAAILHDAGKPACARPEGKRMRFFGHESRGARIAETVFRRLHLSTRETALVSRLITEHMRLISLAAAPEITGRALFRLHRDLGEGVPALMLLTLADCASYRRLRTAVTVPYPRMRTRMAELARRYFALADTPPRMKLINGTLLMERLGLEPGPLIGKLLRAVEEAQALGKVSTTEEALALAARRLTRRAK